MSDSFRSLFAAQVAANKDRLCVSAKDGTKTYAELEQSSDRIAAELQARNVKRGDHVGICLDRTTQMLAALLAVWKTGAAYVPIDPTYPRKRIRHMVDDSCSRLIVTQSHIDKALFGPTANLLIIDGETNMVRSCDAVTAQNPSDVAYTIYTSGSTGKPKGVQVTHGNVMNFLQSMRHTPGLDETDRILAVTTLSFDIAVLELFLPLISGASIEIASKALASNGPALAQRIDAGDITVMQATPSTWRMLLDAGWTGNSNLKALAGGESLPKEVVARLIDRVGVLWNMYGPTETTVWSTCFEINDVDTPILIGKPIDNTSVHVVDEKFVEVATGEAGELLIGGAGVASGYYNQATLTEDRFVPDTFSDGGGRLFRTGDLVKRLPDGNLQFVNRLDNQVKLRGYRIELGEIESVVVRHAAVSQCVVVLRIDNFGESRLVAYVKNEGVQTTTAGELRAHAQRELPEFMTPAVWVFVEYMPLTPNGKIDRNALPEPSTDRPDLGQAYVPPRTPVEKELAKIWKRTLDLDKVGTRDRFFDLGGNSIKAIQFVDQLGKRIDEKISMPGFFGAPTIGEFAVLLERDHASGIRRIVGQLQSGRARSVQDAATQSIRQRRSSGHEDLAIVGMAVRLPGAANTGEFWTNLRDGVESRHEVVAEDLIAAGLDPSLLDDPTYVPACMPLEDVDKFDASFFGINPREAQMMDPQHRIFLECCWTAMEDAGYAPDNCADSVGVYAGIARNAYQLHNISATEDWRVNAHDYSILLGNDKDFLATRVSYNLNLQGPSMSVLTACSGSGTALHQARLALLNGDCDMALVGGGRVMSPHKVGYHYVDGNVLSADGHVHAFDASASGMVRGSGLVAVLVKRLSAAIEAGDDIKAVIKSTAVNNDGAAKASFTAPSVPGQVRAIRQAFADADFSPDSVTYVEAHGTGTRLGDPIEVAALTEAWQERKKGNGYCAIGSSKTNIGHLDAGACVTGIIKTALTLQHKQIPPSLNFEKPNPLIDFENSPFYVNTKLSEWSPSECPRRAAVSSFGVGGTNVHVLMEEAPEPEESSGSRPRQLLLLSAKRPEAIVIQAAELSSRLSQDEHMDLADVAYTLQVGRSSLPLRHSIICSDRNDAIMKLNKVAGVEPKAAEDGASVVFMFPGQGSQHVNMARELYEHEAVYKVHFEHCARALKPLLGLDLREIVYPPEGADVEVLSEQMKQTEIAQLALFSVEYSLAKLWISWGIEPASMIGHSVGEFVAACLSGVIELHDCLRVLHCRASLMGSMPPGDMLAVTLGTEDVQALLENGISIAASNAPEVTVVSGNSTAISGFREKLEDREIQTYPLHTSHAFHSEMMAPILQPFIDAFHGIELGAPKVPFISSLSGDWISDEQAKSPEYWAAQLRNGVQFSKGVATIVGDDAPVFLEVGPSTALSNSVRKHSSSQSPLAIVSTLSSAHKPNPALETTLGALGQLWSAGVLPDWSKFYACESRRRATLPTYPFERVRHWIEPPLGWAGEESADAASYHAVMAALYGVPEDSCHTQDDAESGDHSSRTRDRLKAMLFDITGIPIATPDESASFLDLGFDSLLLTQISGRITKDFKVSLRFWELIEDYSSVETLGNFLAEQLEETVPKVSLDTVEQIVEEPSPVSDSAPAAAQSNNDLTSLVARQSLIIDVMAERLRQQILAANDDGTLPPSSIAWEKDFPPVTGAKLGRSPEGKPGWYVEDPDNDNEYNFVMLRDE